MRLAALPIRRTRYRDRGETSALGTHRSETHKIDPHHGKFSANNEALGSSSPAVVLGVYPVRLVIQAMGSSLICSVVMHGGLSLGSRLGDESNVMTYPIVGTSRDE